MHTIAFRFEFSPRRRLRCRFAHVSLRLTIFSLSTSLWCQFILNLAERLMWIFSVLLNFWLQQLQLLTSFFCEACCSAYVRTYVLGKHGIRTFAHNIYIRWRTHYYTIYKTYSQYPRVGQTYYNGVAKWKTKDFNCMYENTAGIMRCMRN